LKHDAEPQASHGREQVVNMVRNHSNSPSQRCDRGHFTWFGGWVELPASYGYTTGGSYNKISKIFQFSCVFLMSFRPLPDILVPTSTGRVTRSVPHRGDG